MVLASTHCHESTLHCTCAIIKCFGVMLSFSFAPFLVSFPPPFLVSRAAPSAHVCYSANLSPLSFSSSPPQPLCTLLSPALTQVGALYQSCRIARQCLYRSPSP